VFKRTKLYVPKYGVREILIREIHGGALASHYGEKKMTIMLKEHYYWPSMSKDV